MSLSSFKSGMALESAPAGTTAFQAEAADWKRSGAKLTVTPKAGLLPEREYRLSFSALQDVFGAAKEPFSIAFSTAPSGYQSPKAVILSPQDGAACVAGYPASVRAKVTQGTSPLTRAELYANGQAVQTLTAAPWEFAYTPAQADRTDELFLRVYDQAGGMTESERVHINIVTNQAPVVSFTSLTEGQTLESGAQVAVQASDSDGGVERIAFYIDGELITEAEGETAVFTIPQEISFARHVVKAVAYDIYGEQGSASAGVIISKLLQSAVYESDFSGYKGTKENPGSITGFALVTNRNEKQEHYIMNGTVDEAHGNSVILGSDSKTAANSCWAGINITAAAPEKILLKTSLYFQSANSETHLILRNADGSVFVEDVIFYNGQLQYCNGAEKYSTPMKTGTWYEIEYEIDLAGNSYALTVNGQEFAKNYQFSKKLDSLSGIRVDINNRDTQPAWIAVAKFQVYRIYAFPYITGARLFCGDTDVTEDGQLTADKIVLQMNGAVNIEKFMVKGVLLTGDGRGIPADWEWNSDRTQIELTLKHPLEPEYLYKMQMNYQYEGKAYTSDLPLQMPPAIVGAKSAAFETGDRTIWFTAELANDTPEDREVTVLLVKYDHGVLADLAQQQMTIPAGGAHISSPALVYEQSEGVTYEAFLWDNWQSRRAINNKFYQP